MSKICPLFTAAGMVGASSLLRTTSSGPQTKSMEAVPCLQGKCGFWNEVKNESGLVVAGGCCFSMLLPPLMGIHNLAAGALQLYASEFQQPEAQPEQGKPQ